jgi:sporulation protein YlmC with PRC-barrel domain
VETLADLKKLIGKKVIGANGIILGEVEGTNLEIATWKITGLQIGLTNEAALEAGFKRPMLSQIIVVIPPTLVSAVGDVITLTVQVKDLKDLVNFSGFR